MAKKGMNKILKLTLFLGATALISGGLLTGVHLLTSPIIERTEQNRKFDGYKKVLTIESFERVSEDVVSDELKTAGITGKSSFYNGDMLLGVVYDVSMKGYAPDPVKFQLGIKGDNFVGFNLLTRRNIGICRFPPKIDTKINGDKPLLTAEIFVDELGVAGVSKPAHHLKTCLLYVRMIIKEVNKNEEVKNLKMDFYNNSIFLFLGMCPTLATTKTFMGALGMGLAIILTLILTNVLISLVRKIVPNEVRIPVLIVIITTVVSIVEMTMKAFMFDSKQIGVSSRLFINCIILGSGSFCKLIVRSLGTGLGFGGFSFFRGTGLDSFYGNFQFPFRTLILFRFPNLPVPLLCLLLVFIPKLT